MYSRRTPCPGTEEDDGSSSSFHTRRRFSFNHTISWCLWIQLLPFLGSIFSESTRVTVSALGNFRRGNVRPFVQEDKFRVYVQLDDSAGGVGGGFFQSSFSLQSSENPVFYEFRFNSVNSVATALTQQDIDRLRQDPRVRGIEFDPPRLISSSRPSLIKPSESEVWNATSIRERNLVVLQQNLEQIQALQTHTFTRGAGVKICIIDSGVSVNHIDLDKSKFSGLVDNNNADETFLRWDQDVLGHGTHVAGIIAAKSDNQIGITGVAPDSDIFIVRAFGDRFDSFVYSSGIIDAAYQCVNNGAKIITMALAGQIYTESERLAFNDITNNRGALIVAAAGNFGPTADIRYPAGYPDVISVSAVDSRGQTTTFSQANEFVDIAAPGQDILSLYPNNQYAQLDGTSMACAHVAGVLALMWASVPSATPNQLREALFATAQDEGLEGRDDFYGNGIVKALDALTYLHGLTSGGSSSTPVPTPVPTPSPTPSPTPPPQPVFSDTLLLNANSYVQGETITVEFRNIAGMDSLNTLKIFPSDENNFANDGIIQESIPPSTAQYSIRVTFPQTGFFKIFLTNDSLTVLASSTIFEIKENVQTLILDKTMYATGDQIMVSYNNLVGWTAQDRMVLVPATASSTMTFEFLDPSGTTLFPTDTLPYSGLATLELVLDGTDIVIAESPIFEISPLLQLDRSNYIQGETMVISWRSYPGSSVLDNLLLFDANEADYTSGRQVLTISSIGSGTTASTRIDFSDTGTFKFVLLAHDSSRIVGESSSFTIQENIRSLTLDKTSYHRGEYMTVSFDGVPQVTTFDDIKLVNAGTTDFSGPGIIQTSSVGADSKLTYRINFEQTGSFKFVLVIDQTGIVIGQSSAFDIVYSQQTFSLNRAQFFHGENIGVSLGNINGYVSSDDLKIVRGDVSSNFGRAQTFARVPTTTLRQRIAFPETGQFKVVLLIDGTGIPLAESPVFTVSPNQQVLRLDDDRFELEETTRVRLPSNARGVESNDDLRVYPVFDNDGTINLGLPGARQISSAFDGTDRVSLRFNFAPPGKFKLVLVLDGTNISLGMSETFDVLPHSEDGNQQRPPRQDQGPEPRPPRRLRSSSPEHSRVQNVNENK